MDILGGIATLASDLMTAGSGTAYGLGFGIVAGLSVRAGGRVLSITAEWAEWKPGQHAALAPLLQVGPYLFGALAKPKNYELLDESAGTMGMRGGNGCHGGWAGQGRVGRPREEAGRPAPGWVPRLGVSSTASQATPHSA
jgi:hypothetical protein